MNEKNNLLLLIGAILLASCNQNAPQSQSDAPALEISTKKAASEIAPAAPVQKPSAKGDQSQKQEVSTKEIKTSIVGVWVLKGDNCDSGGGVILDASGKFGSEGDYGNWSVAANKLNMNYRQEEGEQAEANVSLKVLSLGAENAILQREDGSNFEWERCPQVPHLEPVIIETK